VLKLRRFRP